MITEDEDDTHFCLKCHGTITGLDNYIAHRKSGCGNQASVHSKCGAPSPLITTDEPKFDLKADDFFSLLELQSSSKKSTLQVPSTSKNNSGVLTRSKATAAIQASNLHKDTPYCLSDKRATDWIGGHALLGNEENQINKLITAVDNISGNIKKDEPTSLSDVDLDVESNDDYDDEEEDFEVVCPGAPPQSHTGGKWKPTSSPIQWLRPTTSHNHHEERNEWDTPPPSHTGGKWKPTPPSRVHEEYRSDEDVPPPGHTKGKWIPGRSSDMNAGGSRRIDIIPPLRKSSGTVQYWCGPCNRRLASKIVYDRHLKSELHYKRTLHEREFDDPSGYLNVKKASRKRPQGKRTIKKPRDWSESESNTDKKKNVKNETKKRRMKTQLSVRCEVCRSKVLTHLMGKHLISHYHCRKRDISKPVAQQMVLDNILSVVQQAPFQCAACRFFCNAESEFLRHWRSFQHNATVERTDGLLLCSFCKFECEHNDMMEEHLLTENHREVISVINRSMPIVIRKVQPVRCCTCNKQFRYNIELRRHCLKENHVVSSTATDKYQEKHRCSECKLIFKSNKSMQNHLKRRHRKNYFYCSYCNLTFDSYHASKLHRRSQQHKYTALTINNEKSFQAKDISKVCKYCFLRFPNVLYLKEHLNKEHPDCTHSCPQCGEKFTLSQEVTRHIRDNKCKFDTSNNASAYFPCAKCPYQTDSQADFFFHEALHTEPLIICDPKTGVTVKKSLFQYKCPVCGKFYKKASLRCHVRLHCNERPYVCKICKNAYARRSNLFSHMKNQHGKGYDEEDVKGRRFSCSICGFSCEHSEQLLTHVQGEHNEELDVEDRSEEKKDESQLNRPEKRFLCSFCGKSFLKKYTLQQHLTVHTGKKISCPHEDCIFSCRSRSELSEHLFTHSEQRSFSCKDCSYKTKTKHQLKRHMLVHDSWSAMKYSCPHCNFSTRLASHYKRHTRIHTGAKPYNCPHCNYACNNLENLRKHVLSTNKHPGKCMYECKFCDDPEESFATNFSKEFRVHLITSHPDRFDSTKMAASYILGIYDAADDPQHILVPIESNRKTSIMKMKTEEPEIEVITCEPTTILTVPISSSILTIPTSTRATPTVLLTSAAEEEPQNVSSIDEYVVVSNPNTDTVYVELPSAGTETWTMEGLYDVEASGTLVPFHGERFEEHDN